jgi:hypothetical protein
VVLGRYPSVAISSFRGGQLEGRTLLVRRFDALAMCQHGDHELVQAFDTLGDFDRNAGSLLWQFRDFLARAKLWGVEVSSLDDDRLIFLLRERICGGDLVGVRRSKEALAREGDNATAVQRRLVRSVESAAKGLVYGGRHYRLIVGIDLARTSDRDSYQVVSRDEARRLLESMAGQAAGAGGLREFLAKAIGQLSRDWRPPLSPTGLVLLRREAVPRRAPTTTEAAVSPSALRKLRDEGWIEIAFVDAGMEPVANVDFDLRLADGDSKSGKTNQNGSARFEGIMPGECTVRFPSVDGPVVLL